ncbi:HNH endonuclease [Planococcus sp. FY231025]|uniref:HNH endonuclease n=1 Tax=Planococcus sp. FY231025 TaxID=3455699 RepID=UPI003F901A0C
MNSFIVMQGETYHEERNAGILWTPQIDKSGMVPHSWNRMKELQKGDHVFHYVKGEIVAISSIEEGCHKGGVPNRTKEAFIAGARYQELDFPLSVREHFSEIQPLLPLKYSPFQEDASGNSGYLYPCNEELAMRILELISTQNFFSVEEEQLELAIEVVRRTKHNPLLTMISEMELDIKTKMRRGKAQFRKNLQTLWQEGCPLCGIAIEEAMTASYAKPWKDSTDAERLDPYNGILLCANHAALYTAGLIAFTGGGSLRVASRIPKQLYPVYGLAKGAKVPAAPEHAPYFRWHKRNIFVEPRQVRLLKPLEQTEGD